MRVGLQLYAPTAFNNGKDPVPFVQDPGWASGPVWVVAENLAPTRIRSLDRVAHSKSLYGLRYPGPHAWLVALSNSYSTHLNISQDVLLSVCCHVMLHLMLKSCPVCWRGSVMHAVCLCLIFKVAVLWNWSSLEHMFVGRFFFVLVHGMHTENMAAFFRTTLFTLHILSLHTPLMNIYFILKRFFFFFPLFCATLREAQMCK